MLNAYIAYNNIIYFKHKKAQQNLRANAYMDSSGTLQIPLVILMAFLANKTY